MTTTRPSSDDTQNLRPTPLQDVANALQFLTRIPTPQVPYTPDSLSRALPFFPLVGVLLAVLAALILRTAEHIFTPLLSSILAITSLLLLTGCLHEDGLADCADAFGSPHTRARTLEILRDSRNGTYGTLALILSVAFRTFALASLPTDRIFPALIAALTLSRWSALPLSLLPPARTEAEVSQAARITLQTTRPRLLLGTALALGLTAAAAHLVSIVYITIALTITALTALYYRRRLAGVTGDCFGATSQLIEIAILLTAAATAGVKS